MSISIDQVEKPTPQTDLETEPRQLTPELAGKLFFLSFKFSQGNPDLQRDIFRYVHSMYPEYAMNDDLREQTYAAVLGPIREIITPARLGKLSGKPVRHQSSLGALWMFDDEDAIRPELKAMQEILNGEVGDKGELIRKITKNIIEKDYSYLRRNEGRERFNIQASEMSHPSNDPFLSHLCHYGFLGKHTGVKVFDEMFGEVAQYVRIKSPNFPQSLQAELRTVQEVYNQHHPQLSVPVVA